MQRILKGIGCSSHWLVVADGCAKVLVFPFLLNFIRLMLNTTLKEKLGKT